MTTAYLSSGLTQEAALQLASRRREPDWLRSLRLRAFEQYAATPLAEQSTGNWRRTDFAGLDLADPAITAEPTELAGSTVEAPPTGSCSAVVTLRNGAPAHVWADRALTARGLRVLPLEIALADSTLAEIVRQHLGQVVELGHDKLTALHYAFLNSGMVVFVPRGLVVELPVLVEHQVSQAGLGGFAHTLIVAEDGSEIAVRERSSGAPPIASSIVEIVIGRNAHVRFASLQQWDPSTWCFAYERSRLAADAQVSTFHGALGSRQARVTLQVILNGNGSQADLLGVALGDGRRHLDFQTLQDHFGSATRSDLVIHNALDERSSSNFTGLIRIEPQARATESSQQQKNYLLSTRAKADSDPRLEILNNDVIRCTHGASVGPVDPDLIFYLQSRGLDTESARGLILEGFFRTVLARLHHSELETATWAPIASQLHLQEI